MNVKLYAAAALLSASIFTATQAKAQAQPAGTVYTGVGVYTVNCGSGAFTQYGPAKIVQSKNGAWTLKYLQ